MRFLQLLEKVKREKEKNVNEMRKGDYSLNGIKLVYSLKNANGV